MSTMIRNAGGASIASVLEQMELGYEPGVDGAATLYIDGLRIRLTPCENKLRFEFKLGDLPTDPLARENKVLEIARFAAGNLANMNANRETLTIGENGLEMLLFRIVTTDDLEVDKCLENLAEFVDAAEYWQRAVGHT